MVSRGKESEAKYRLRPGQRERIEGALGGSRHRRSEQTDQYYDVGERVLRLRQEGGRWFLTYKDSPRITPCGVKVRGEVETPIPEPFAPDLEALILWLGHARLTTVRKVRDAYDLDGATVCLDRVEGLPDDYAEIEVLGDAPDGLSRLARLRDRLGLTDDQAELRSYARLVAQGKGEPIHGRE